MAKKSQGGRGSKGSQRRSNRPPTNRQFARTARLNTLVKEIVADFFERVDDDRFHMLTITGVEVDSDLNVAQVFVSTLDRAAGPQDNSEEADEDLLEALRSYRKAIRFKIGSETRLRKTPNVVFAVDPAVRAGARIEEILANLNPSGSDDDDAVDEQNSDDGYGDEQE